MGRSHAPPSYQGTEKSCLIRFIVTFYIFGYERPVIVEAGCVVNIDLSADPGIEKSPAQWNEAEKQHIKNDQMKRLLGLSELLSVLRPLRVSVFLSEEGCNPPTASQSWCKQTLTHKHRVLPPLPPSHGPFARHAHVIHLHFSFPDPTFRSLLLHPAFPLCATAVCNWAVVHLVGFKQKMTYNFLPEKKERKEKIDAVPRKPEHSDMPFLGKCLLTRVHTCFWSTHHQSSIKFTQANHANHQ